MSNPTSNFGWQMPTNSDLVTDLPADFEVFGQAVDTSLADLKGGTTGQVLSKTSNTDMDFTWVSPTTGDITGVTAGTGLTGGGTSGDVTVSFDVANYGGGQKAAGKNCILNGAMDIWQRGTSAVSPTPTTAYFSADRWNFFRAVAGATFTQQATNDTTNLPFIQYCIRVARDSGNTATNLIGLYQNIENSMSTPYIGQAVVLSFYARAGANYSGGTLDASIMSGTGTNENQINGLTGTTVVATGGKTLTTTWQRFTIAGTVAASAKQLGIKFLFTPTGTAGAADYYEITGVQLELGSTATQFSRAGGTIQGELAACQRYYYRNTANAVNKYLSNQGAAVSTTSARIPIICPVPMRVAPTSVDFSNIGLDDGVNATVAVTATGIIYSADQTNVVGCAFTVASGLTQYRNYGVFATSSGGYLGFSSEL